MCPSMGCAAGGRSSRTLQLRLTPRVKPVISSSPHSLPTDKGRFLLPSNSNVKLLARKLEELGSIKDWNRAGKETEAETQLGQKRKKEGKRSRVGPRVEETEEEGEWGGVTAVITSEVKARSSCLVLHFTNAPSIHSPPTGSAPLDPVPSALPGAPQKLTSQGAPKQGEAQQQQQVCVAIWLPGPRSSRRYDRAAGAQPLRIRLYNPSGRGSQWEPRQRAVPSPGCGVKGVSNASGAAHPHWPYRR